jgi:hypothetical protein
VKARPDDSQIINDVTEEAEADGEGPPEVCVFCGKEIEDWRVACSLWMRREWMRGALDWYACHITCFRTAAHQRIY